MTISQLDSLFDAVKAGRSARAVSMSPNPYPIDTPENAAFEAGYSNDLDAWTELFDQYRTRPPVSAGRWRAHDSVMFNAHTSAPDSGEFLGYVPGGRARVLLSENGFKCVPVEALTRPAGCAARG